MEEDQIVANGRVPEKAVAADMIKDGEKEIISADEAFQLKHREYAPVSFYCCLAYRFCLVLGSCNLILTI